MGIVIANPLGKYALLTGAFLGKYRYYSTNSAAQVHLKICLESALPFRNRGMSVAWLPDQHNKAYSSQGVGIIELTGFY